MAFVGNSDAIGCERVWGADWPVARRASDEGCGKTVLVTSAAGWLVKACVIPKMADCVDEVCEIV